MGVVQSNSNNILKNTLTDKLINQNWFVNDGLQFNGVNNKINGFGNIFNFERTDSFSFTFYVKLLEDLLLKCILSKKIETTTNVGYYITIYGTVLTLELINNLQANNRLVYQVQLFSLDNLITITYNGTSTSSGINMYSNGILLSPFLIIDNLSGNIASGAEFLIGKRNPPDAEHPFYGSIHDLKIFNKELTFNEVTILNNTQCQLIPNTAIDNCLLDARFEEKQGIVLKDMSGNNNSGSLTNFTNTSVGINNQWVDKYGNPIITL